MGIQIGKEDIDHCLLTIKLQGRGIRIAVKYTGREPIKENDIDRLKTNRI